ncbi:MAG: carbon starvation induced protein CsiD, partial [Oceanospirillaceae bacterium]
LFIEQFAELYNIAQERYLYRMGACVEADPNCSAIALGSKLVLQNHCWLHGRNKFVVHPLLMRELLRQSVYFTQ